MKIVIIHTWGIGDLIMFLPVLKAIKLTNPNANIDFYFFQKSAALPIKKSKLINSINYFVFKPLNLIKTILKIRKQKYDYAYVTSGVNPKKASLFLRFCNAKNIIGEYWQKPFKFYTKNIKYDNTLHRLQCNIKLFSNLFNKNNLIKKTFYCLDNTDFAKANNFIQKNNLGNKLILGVHPGCNYTSRFRRWPMQYFVECLKLIKQQIPNINFVLFAGPDEQTEGDYIQNNIDVFRVNGFNLNQTAALISKCDFFFNSDSGLGHIASCFDNVKIFTIFGPADDTFTAPISKNAMVIKKNSCPKQPCEQKNPSNCSRNCLIKLTPKEVSNIIIKKIKENI